MFHGHKSMSRHEHQMALTNYHQLQASGVTGDPIDRLRMLCLSRGATGILGLGRMFRRMDHDGSKLLDEDEFLFGLQNSGLEIMKEEAHVIFQKFDTDHTGGVNIDEFMKAIYPPMSESRMQILEKAYDKMDKNGDGIITAANLKRAYNVQHHPLYLSGEETEKTIFQRFLLNFENGAAEDGHVTKEEFFNYYAAISASIDTDGYFDLMMRQCYKL